MSHSHAKSIRSVPCPKRECFVYFGACQCYIVVDTMYVLDGLAHPRPAWVYNELYLDAQVIGNST